MARRRIDVHQHIVPPPYAAWLRSKGVGGAGGRELPHWSTEDALALMDDHDIAARVAEDHPGPFGFFATLPLPDVDGALAELAYAFDTLRASGVILLASTHGQYLGAPEHEPLFAELEDFASFYFDTALSGSPAALPSLLAFAKPGHVLFGSDWPYAPPIAVGYFTGQLDAHAALDGDGHAAIDRGNAEALFPRFARRAPKEIP